MSAERPIVERRDSAGIRILRLARPRANALNAELVEALNAQVEEAQRDDGVEGLLIESAQPGFFSAGFDLQEVFAYERPEMQKFFARFVALYEGLLRFSKPVGGALSGHTVAGGAFLALCFDVRVMAEGDYVFGVNEVTFGAIVPTAVTRLLIDAVGARVAAQLLLSGETVNPKRALEIGLVDAVVPVSDVTATALGLLTPLAKKPRGAFGLAKRKLHEDLGHLATSKDPHAIDEFLDQWFSPDCIALRRKIADSVLKRRS